MKKTALLIAFFLTLTRAALAAPFAYITNEMDNTVSVIDTAAGKVIASVPVGTRPDGVAITPDGKFVYTANFEADTVSVIDTSDNKVKATVASTHRPSGIVVSPD